MRKLACLVSVVLLAISPGVRAGLYYSGEPLAELPSQWRGYLVDQRILRNLAAPPTKDQPVSPLRSLYQAAADKLEKAARQRKLTADERADLGALYVRLGESAKAVDLLRPAQREHPDHFRIAANLGTAWQLQGDLGQAALCLEQAVRLAGEKQKKAEELHLKLVRQRQRQSKDSQALDDLFSAKYAAQGGQYQAGKMAKDEFQKLPGDAIAMVQQLALWLPADGRLLWQLAELANAHGDVKTAAAIMEGCVTEFGMSAAELRAHRQATRAAADALTKAEVKAAHKEHAAAFKPRSRRPLLTRLDPADLPAISPKGVNAIPWTLLGDTQLDSEFKPTFPKYLKELEGKQISLSGFMQPIREDAETSSFMLLEYPVGCWYCETPEMTGIVLVELPKGKTTTLERGLVKIAGKLSLNAANPETFLFSVGDAKLSEAD